jgi:hypothetical protein
MIPSVLIIEDERILAEAMRHYLGRHGYDPAVAEAGEEIRAEDLGLGAAPPSCSTSPSRRCATGSRSTASRPRVTSPPPS